MNPRTAAGRGGALLLVAGFIGMSAAPLVDQFARDAEVRGPRLERRAAAPAVEWPVSPAEVLSLPRRIEARHADTFGLRDKLLRERGRLHWFGLGRSPAPIVDLGGDGWTYTTIDASREAWRGTMPLVDSELACWVDGLARRRDWLARLGVRYLFVVAPNKESIYPEHLPASWKKISPSAPTRLDQLLAALRAQPEVVEAPDLRPALLAARVDDQPGDELYTRLGTHWNGRGSIVAAEAILAQLQADAAPKDSIPREQLRRARLPGSGDSWGPALHIDDLLLQVDWQPEWPREGGARVHVASQGPERTVHSRSEARAGGPRLLVFHDSFGPYVQPLLTEFVAGSLWVQTSRFDLALVEAYKPDVVVELRVERAIARECRLAQEEERRVREAGATPIWSASLPCASPIKVEGLQRDAARGLHLVVAGVAEPETVVQVYWRPADELEFRRDRRLAFAASGSFEHMLSIPGGADAVCLMVEWSGQGSVEIERTEAWLP